MRLGRFNNWGIAYLILIPFYALLYHLFLNGNFYFSTISFENKIKVKLKEELIVAFENSIDSVIIYGHKNGEETETQLFIKYKGYKVKVDNFHCYEQDMKDYFDFNIMILDTAYTPFFIMPIIKIHIPQATSRYMDYKFINDGRYNSVKFNDSIVVKEFNGFLTFYKSYSKNTVSNDTFYTVNTNYSIYTNTDTLQGFLDYSDWYNIEANQEISFVETYINSNKYLIAKLGEYYTVIKENKSIGYNNYLRMLYFSTVVITTLGFGDIVPVSDLARIVVASEAILGIIFIGLFLNNLSKNKQ